ncbi:response regulator [Niveispirillum fermenti]|uniref:response regulator n=1 Tax=Niveispirillum fermenti TaxID=1233113 RepID=UPI003A84DC78
MRLRVLIPLLILLLAGAMTALAVLGLSREWALKHAADRALAADPLHALLVETVSAMAAERRDGYDRLAHRSPEDIPDLPALEEVRRRTDGALDRLTAGLPASELSEAGIGDLRAGLASLRRGLAAQREEMDDTLTLPWEDRPQAWADRWFGAMNGMVGHALLLHQMLDDHTVVMDDVLAAQIALRYAASDAAEQVERAGPLLTGALTARGAVPTLQTLTESGTRFTLAWDSLRQRVARNDGGQDADGLNLVRQTVERADRLIGTHLEPQRRRAIALLASGAHDPTVVDEWNTAASLAVDALRQVESATLRVVTDRARTLSDDAASLLVRSAVICLLALAGGVAALLLVHGRVLRPLTGVTRLFEQITRGETNVSLPHITRADEIGDLTRAATAFRAVHLAGEALAEALRRRERLLDLFIRHAPTAIAMLDTQMRFVAVSRRWQKDYRLEDRDLTGLCHYDMFPAAAAHWRPVLERCLAGEAAAAEDPFPQPDGSTVWLRWEVHPWHDLDGGIGGIVMFTEEVTARKRAEAETRRLTAELQAIVDSADNAIIATDPVGIIRAFNRGAERMLGYRAQDLVGKETPKLFHDQNEIAEALAKLVASLGRPVADPFEALVHRARQGKPDQREWTYIARDGQRVPVLLSVTAIRDGRGEIQGFLGVANDIAHLKEMDRLKSEFISTVSHELRTPLTAIRAALGMVNSDLFGPLPGEARQLTDIAQDSTERLIRLINDLLDIEKIASGKMRFDWAPQALDDLLDRAVRDNNALAEKAGIRLLPGPGLEPGTRLRTRVRADADRMAQAFANLIGNAVKFSPAGSTVTLSAETLRDHFVRVTIADQGIGIDPSFRQRIFQRFAQADGSDSRDRGGTGLGLAITREIVERHGGRIGFDSEPGAGSRFHIDLPPAPSAALPPVLHLPALPPSAADHAPCVLICEDDPDIGRLLALMLGRAGYATSVASTAAEALDMLERHRFDAMTLDLMLPDLPGLTLFRAVRDRAETRELPIIVVTASGDAGRAAVEGDAVGIIDWLTKPIEEPRLLSALRRAAAISRPGQRPRLLHVEDDEDVRAVVRHLLSGQTEMVAAPTLGEALRLAAAGPFDVGIVDIDMPDGCGLDVIPHLRDAEGGPVPIVVFTAADAGPVRLRQVAATLVKSRARNEELVQTIRSLIHRMTPAEGVVIPSASVEIGP